VLAIIAEQIPAAASQPGLSTSDNLVPQILGPCVRHNLHGGTAGEIRHLDESYLPAWWEIDYPPITTVDAVVHIDPSANLQMIAISHVEILSVYVATASWT
jgi:hypothetical protein